MPTIRCFVALLVVLAAGGTSTAVAAERSGTSSATSEIRLADATYVEPIARVQVGQLTAEKIWRDMLQNMPKGLPAAGDQGLDNTHTWGRTYWGGALFYLQADVRIRERTGNRSGLQDALRAIVANGGNVEVSWDVRRTLAMGVAGSKGFATEGNIELLRGDRAQVAGYTFVHEGATRNADAHKMSVRVRLGVYRGGDRVATLTPGTDLFRADGTRASDVAINSRPSRDLYVVLTRLTEDGAASLTVFVNPLVLWLWIAGVLVALGGLLAAWPGPPSSRRERARSPAASGEARA